MAQGILFAGNPDTVYRQVMEFYDQVGGFGHLTPGRPLGLHDPRRVGEEHPALLEGGAPAPARDQARHRRLTDRERAMYEGFRRFDIQTSDPQVSIHGVVGGAGLRPCSCSTAIP